MTSLGDKWIDRDEWGSFIGHSQSPTSFQIRDVSSLPAVDLSFEDLKFIQFLHHW